MSLTRVEAQARAVVVTPLGYTLDLDLTRGDREFGSLTRLTFRAEAGASTFIDLDAVRVHSLTLNGVDLPASAVHGRRVTLTGLRELNELVVDATMAYGRDGQGLHRANDPADGNDYVYGHLFMDAAPRVYACFDQPDLKAPYDVTVRAPQGWSVITNGAVVETEPQVWKAATTQPLATYFVTVCAGPFASIRAEHDGIPLGLHARASLAAELEEQADEMLAVTRASFDYYHSLFGIRYPFGEYHQVFVPEFNAGAMENPGCVTFRDQLIFVGAASRAEHLTRANTISHEMAHMWFGDLVTMQWWDDLWLNESFAEYLASRTLVAATEFTDAWVAVASGRKAWGYAAERSPSTHPVAGAPAPDTDTALQNFDGISYAKGSAALRQLILHVGDDAFIAGVRLHLRRHAFANASLADFLAALTEASGQNLNAWVQTWLTTAGMDTVRVVEDEGHTQLLIEPNPQHPVTRQHTLRVVGLDRAGEVVAAENITRGTGRVPLPEITAARLRGEVSAIIPNDADLTWAGVEFDERTTARLADVLPGIADAVTRGMIWTSLAHGVATAAVNPARVLDIMDGALAAEAEVPVLDVAMGLGLSTVVRRFLPWARRAEALGRLELLAQRMVDAASGIEDGRHLAGARLLAATGSAERLRPWFSGVALPAGLEDDAPFRWRVAHRLADLDAVTLDELEAALDADPTMSGRLGYLTARAAFPTAEAKEWAWEELTAPPTAGDQAHSNYEMNALATGFWSAADEATLAPYIERYVDDIPRMREWVGEDALARVAALAFPAGLASEQLDVECRRLLQRDEVPAAVHRAVIDQQALVREVLESRIAFES